MFGRSDFIDLRSDTVTRPTARMYERMQDAPLGDDGLEGDPSAVRLEAAVADLLGKEAGLFVPSCTMANMLAILTLTQRFEQVALEQDSHIYTMECGATFLGGALFRPVSGSRGQMDLDHLADTVAYGKRRHIPTRLICLETSHNNSGGTVLPLEHIDQVATFARRVGASMHLDGARIFNACAFLNVAPSTIAAPFDTASICLSKGLSAPAGALLVGTTKTIHKARQLRKFLGGTQRQIGILAAAGLEAITTMRGRLHEDHQHAKLLSQLIKASCPNLQVSDPETNIVQLDCSATGKSSDHWVDALDRAGVKVRAIGSHRIRCVTHRHIDAHAIRQAAEAFRMIG
ncbi:threonine aldolase [Candidimonas nitroreducens]|uniref:Threonine aldolase n=2 Tax=Candidimonas nitroreducens TaxID=683354 RepID=A0A225MZB4_9BURK|nr:threonine aldolase [Candidimonas nitroreducens]